MADALSDESWGYYVLLFAATAAVAGKLILAPIANIHWDEFHYLSHVHNYLRGDIATAFQMLHVHLFAWLPSAGENEIEQIVAARVVTHTALLGLFAAVYGVTNQVAGRMGAALAVFAVATHSYFALHAGSFRPDSLIAPCGMTALFFLLRYPALVSAQFCAAGLIALAAAISVKTIFYAPVVLAVWIAVFGEFRSFARWLGNLALFAVACAAFFVVIYSVHATAIPTGGVGESAGRLAGVGTRIWASRSDYLDDSLTTDWAFWLLTAIGLGVGYWWVRFGGACERSRGILLLGLLVPLATVFFYRNAYPYFYVVLVPLFGIVAGVAFQELWDQAGRRLGAIRLALLFLLVPMLLTALKVHRGSDLHPAIPVTMEPQARLIETIHDLFPEPVPYIDGIAMMSSYPRVGPFMSRLGLEGYRASNGPRIPELVATREPVFLLENVSALNLRADWENVKAWGFYLPEDDFKYLAEYYVPYWGPLRVAGRTIRLMPGQTRSLSLPVRGTYTVVTDAPVLLDGEFFTDSRVYENQSGTVKVFGLTEVESLTIRYGTSVDHIDTEPPMNLFRGMH